jgi:hypothetical protein
MMVPMESATSLSLFLFDSLSILFCSIIEVIVFQYQSQVLIVVVKSTLSSREYLPFGHPIV